jgi:hypothetical protein
MTALADYMKAQFGVRAEPWLVDDGEPELERNVEGSGDGIVKAPEDATRSLSGPRGVVTSSDALLPREYAPSGMGRPTTASETRPARLEEAFLRPPPARAALRPSARRPWRWIGGGVGAAGALAAAILLVVASSKTPAAAPAAMLQAVMPSTRPTPLAPPAQIAPLAPSPVVQPASPDEVAGNGSVVSRPLEPSRPVRKRHHTSRRDTSKKHWDPSALFPR